jgi:hypothetical protein
MHPNPVHGIAPYNASTLATRVASHVRVAAGVDQVKLCIQYGTHVCITRHVACIHKSVLVEVRLFAHVQKQACVNWLHRVMVLLTA